METPAPVATGTGAGSGHSDCTRNYSKNDANWLANCLERITENDRQWFSSDPRRRWRVRPALPGELPGSHVAVRDIGGAARMRLQFINPIPPGLTDRGLDKFVELRAAPEQVRLIAEIETIVRERGR